MNGKRLNAEWFGKMLAYARKTGMVEGNPWAVLVPEGMWPVGEEGVFSAARAAGAVLVKVGREVSLGLCVVSGCAAAKYCPGRSKPKGVRGFRGGFRADICVGGVREFLGTFDGQDEAGVAYDRACDRLGVPGRKNG